MTVWLTIVTIMIFITVLLCMCSYVSGHKQGYKNGKNDTLYVSSSAHQRLKTTIKDMLCQMLEVVEDDNA